MSIARTLEVPGYEVIQYLGSGARSTIWRIRDCRDDGVYALKRVVKRQAGDGRFLEQALNEYNVASRLNHPVIRRIYHINRIKRWLSLHEIHLIMEFCDGQTVQENRPESVLEAVRILSEVGSAVAYMNAQGFLHADMKPNNILIAPDGTVKIIDLGQSCPVGTVKQRIQGTPDFIAPEQVRRQPLDARTDVFNFAAALYWTVTGRAIPTILPKKNTITFLADLALVPPEKINPAVPPALSKLISDCIEINPAHRPSSMSQVISRLNLISRMLTQEPKEPQTQ